MLGILFIIPVQTFYAEKFHNGYTGSYFAQYVLFFTKLTDFTGYSGGFTPGQLWFILYLFVISVCVTPLLRIVSGCLAKRSAKRDCAENPPHSVCSSLGFIFLLVFAAVLCKPLLNIGGKSIAEYAYYYSIGYLLLSRDESISSVGCKLKLLGLFAAVFTVSFAAAWVLKWYTVSEIFYFAVQQLYASSVMLAYYILQLPFNCALSILLLIIFTAFISFSLYQIYKYLLKVSLSR